MKASHFPSAVAALSASAVLSAAAVLTTSVALSVPARAEYQTSYTFNVNTGQPVTNVMLLETGDGWGGGTWAFTVSGQGQSTLVNPFTSQDPTLRTLLIGIVQGLPGDADPEEKHIVLFMDPTAAGLAENIAWGTLFTSTLEEQLIADLELATSGQDWPIIQPGLDAVGAFVNGDAMHGILGPGGVEHSAWFDTGGPLTVMTWSQGTIVGDGFSEVIDLPDPCPGDFNGDRHVDLSDLSTLLAHFGMFEGAGLADGDTDGDGDVDLSDLSTLLSHFGVEC